MKRNTPQFKKQMDLPADADAREGIEGICPSYAISIRCGAATGASRGQADGSRCSEDALGERADMCRDSKRYSVRELERGNMGWKRGRGKREDCSDSWSQRVWFNFGKRLRNVLFVQRGWRFRRVARGTRRDKWQRVRPPGNQPDSSRCSSSSSHGHQRANNWVGAGEGSPTCNLQVTCKALGKLAKTGK